MKRQPVKSTSGPLGLRNTTFISDPDKRLRIAVRRAAGLSGKAYQLHVLSGYDVLLVLQAPPGDQLPSLVYTSQTSPNTALDSTRRLLTSVRQLPNIAQHNLTKLLEHCTRTTIQLSNEDMRRSEPRIGSQQQSPPEILVLPSSLWRDPCFSHRVYTKVVV